MVRTSAGVSACCLLAILFGGLLPAWGASPTQDFTRRKDQQKQVRETTDHLVRRVSTMLRVLDYYQLDRRAQGKLLDEVASTLSGLSKEQMQEVLARLNAAAKAPDGARQGQEMEAAYARHREILEQLRHLLARYEAVRNLDQAADQLEKSSRDQLELYVKTTQMAQVLHDGSRREEERRALRTQIPVLTDEQRDLRRDVGDLFRKLEKLRDQLPPDQQARLANMETAARKLDVLAKLERAANQLPRQEGDRRPEAWKGASDLQRESAADLQNLAHALRAKRDRLEVLREARERLDRAVQEQTTLRQEAQAAKEKQEHDGSQHRPDSETARQAREQSAREARLEHAARETQDLLQPQAPKLADRITPAEEAMHAAEQELRQNTPAKALEPQAKAADTLADVRKDLDHLIAEAEKEQHDPLTALENAEQKVDKLLREEKDARDKTREADQAHRPDRLTPLADKQQDLAQRAAEVRDQPRPADPKAQDALDKATRAMETAAHDLKDQKAPDALARQDEAVKSLEEAKEELGKQVAEAKARQEEIARLEDAERKLGELAHKEGEVGDQARHLDQKAGEQRAQPEQTQELGKKQGDLTPQAREVGKQIEQSAPEAAKKVAHGTEHMEAAKQDIDKGQLPPAAGQADQAAKDLEEARKEVARALEEKQGEEIAAEAALEGKEVDPANAAQQIAKALEQAEQAAEQSEQAAARVGEKADPQGEQAQAHPPDLAKLQQQVADQAKHLDLPKAGQPAQEAAEALKKGDLNSAVEEQKKALAQLQEAAKEQGHPEGEHNGEPGAKPHTEEQGHPGDKEHPGEQGHPGEHGQEPPGQPHEGQPAGTEAKNPGELAQAQQALLEATEALARSQEATQAAQAALEQAQAQAPEGAQPRLQEAGKQLADAGQQLHQGEPIPANQAQNRAVGELKQALQAMNAALAAMGQPEPRPGQPKEATAKAEKPGQGQKPGQALKPAQALAMSKTRSPSQERNQGKSTGDRRPDGKVGNAPSRLNDVRGDGSFIGLPPQEREMIRQILSDKLPPEYAPLIQQYYVNVARGKPAARPTTPERP